MRRHPDDAAALTVLGRVWLAWPVFGRFHADSILARACALAPRDPEPFYYRGLVGLRLGGDDGEAMARHALVRVLTLDPHYRDAWALWSTLYRADAERREMVAALRRHAGDHAADLWRAGLLVELREYDAAAPFLDSLIDRTPDDPAPRAWLARALYEQGRDAEAAPVYRAAIARADADTGDVLWHQVRSIASPAERDLYATLAPEQRQPFFRLFWERRDPDLSDRMNRRIGEHFRRLVEAHRYYALLHPLSRWNHSRLWRTLRGGLGMPEDASAEAATARAGIAGFRHASVADEPLAEGVAPRLDEAGQTTVNLEDGLDDRGRILVRYGPPNERDIWSLDAETWRYNLPGGQLQVTFLRRTADGGGDEVVTPVVAGEAAAAAYLLRTDRPSRAATLRFSFWTAAFRHGEAAHTELVVFPDSVAALGALFDASGMEVGRDSAPPGRALHFVVAPGDHDLLALDAARAGREGRYRGSQVVPWFRADTLSVSSILIASGALPARRSALEAAAAAGLKLPVRRPVRLYAEVYGLAAAGGVARYDARYRFTRTTRSFLGGRRHHPVIAFRFRRTITAADPAIESLVVDPGRLPAGHYRLVLEIHDAVSGERAASGSLEFDLR